MKTRSVLVWFLCFAFALGLRLVWLQSDAYAALSWSSESVTDEGFYCHDARNSVLFGQATVEGDDFHNALIMPLLHGVQTVVFHLFGFGIGQARAISVVCSLLTLLLLYAACKRAFGVDVARLAVLLLAFDHVNLLYNRLALMDTPAQMPLVACFYAFARTVNTPPASRSHLGWAFGCGLALVAAYATRGLSAFLVPVPLVLLGCAARVKSEGTGSGPTLTALCFGLLAGAAIYGLLWYGPHQTELRAVNAYYMGHQLLPHSLNDVRRTVQTALTGSTRGFTVYLLRHSPVLFGLALAAIASGLRRDGRSVWQGNADAPTLCRAFVTGWLLVALTCFALIRYAPPRYYVLFYPALATLAALALNEMRGRFAAVLIALWFAINVGWLAYWATHITYSVRDADNWLARHTPANAVLIGDPAPGLALHNGRTAIAVLPGLCNDKAPIETFARTGRPVYVVIFDGPNPTRWWNARYPQIITPQNHKATFPLLGKFNVEVFAVPNN